MIRAANHSSFPKVGDNPLDQQLRSVLRRSERGRADAAEVGEVVEAVTTLCVAEQSRAFIDIVTDGMVGWDGPLSHPARFLEGVRTGGLQRWFESNFYDYRVEVDGPVRRKQAFLLRDYEVAQEVAQTPVKPWLPGPVTFARLALDRHYGDVGQLADALADAFAEEVAGLAGAGATCFQIDEPLLCRHPEDLDLVCRTASRIFDAAGPEATTVLSTYFGTLTAIADDLDRLPGSHIGLDMTEGPASFALLERLPAERGVYLGLFDARSTRQEDAADVAASLEPHRDSLTRRDVLVGPNAGLELLPRDQAFDKLLHARYLVEKLTQEWTWPS